MLDQNTDRMWYVIGAVLLGGLIIAGASGLFTTVMASTNDTFNKVMTDIYLMQNEPNVVYSKNQFSFDETPSAYGWTIGNRLNSVVEMNIPVEPNTKYRMRYNTEGVYPALVVLTQSQEVSKASHNTLYSNKYRIRQLHTGESFAVDTFIDGKNYILKHTIQKDGMKIFDFETSEEELFISLTTGNVTPHETMFKQVTFNYNDIELIKIPK